MKHTMKSRFKWKCRKSKRSSLLIFLILRALIVICMFRQLFWGNYQNVFLCMASLGIMAVPALLHTKLHIALPGALEIAIAFFVFAAEILGEISNFYGQFPFWDSMLHTINGFLAAAIGFGVVDLLNTHIKSIRMSPLFVALVSFCFSMTVGTMWEFFEFSADQLVQVDMQKDWVVQTISSVELNPAGENIPVKVDGIAYTILYDEAGNELIRIEGGYLDVGIIDTMKDLLVNLVGASVFSVLGYLYIRKRDKYKFAGQFMITRDCNGADAENEKAAAVHRGISDNASTGPPNQSENKSIKE